MTMLHTLDSLVISSRVQLESEYDHQSNHITVPFSPAERGLTFLNMGCYTACCLEGCVKGIPWTCETIRKGLSFKVDVNVVSERNIWPTCL